jgi:Domain of unknown function (DUF5671)
MTEQSPTQTPPAGDARVSALAQFIDKALASGVPHDSLVGVLGARGWREKEIYRALGDHCVRTIGLDVPRSRGAGAGSRDAFLYLLIFSTLGIWTTELGSLAFSLINRWLPDPLYSPFQGYELEIFSWSVAALLIAFPIYLLTSGMVARESAADPGRLESPIRKWLTYIALLFAALVCVSDLICALAFLIRGEITGRFVAKALVVLVIAGGVLFHYYSGMRKSDSAPDRSRHNRWMTGLAALTVATMTLLGFLHLGPPREQRELRTDNERVQHLYRLSQYVEGRWKSDGSKLPVALTQIPGGLPTDPATHAAYEYIPGENSHYRLCAKFDLPASTNPNAQQPDPWAHPKGRFCFQLDATQSTNYPNAQFMP